MAVQSLYILNKAGGLVYQRDFKPGLKKISTNEYLVLAGTLHSVHALSTRIAPVDGSSGIQMLQTSKFCLHVLQTLTGIKFVLITDARQLAPDTLLSRVYQLFGDYVMKNPFYQLDMPIRCDKFDRHLEQYLMTIA